MTSIQFDPAVYEQLLLAKDSLVKASTPEPFSTSKTSNWVARNGGLPDYIQHLAHGILRSSKGKKTESEAIHIAIGLCENPPDNWDENAKAAARKAHAEWEALKAKNAAKKGANMSQVDWADVGVDTRDMSFDPDRYQLELAGAREDLDLAFPTFDESKHPRLHGKFVHVGDVLSAKASTSAHFRVEKITPTHTHVRMLGTVPGQTKHNRADKTIGNLHPVAHDNFEKTFGKRLHEAKPDDVFGGDSRNQKTEAKPGPTKSPEQKANEADAASRAKLKVATNPDHQFTLPTLQKRRDQLTKAIDYNTQRLKGKESDPKFAADFRHNEALKRELIQHDAQVEHQRTTPGAKGGPAEPLRSGYEHQKGDKVYVADHPSVPGDKRVMLKRNGIQTVIHDNQSPAQAAARAEALNRQAKSHEAMKDSEKPGHPSNLKDTEPAKGADGKKAYHGFSNSEADTLNGILDTEHAGARDEQDPIYAKDLQDIKDRLHNEAKPFDAHQKDLMKEILRDEHDSAMDEGDQEFADHINRIREKVAGSGLSDVDTKASLAKINKPKLASEVAAADHKHLVQTGAHPDAIQAAVDRVNAAKKKEGTLGKPDRTPPGVGGKSRFPADSVPDASQQSGKLKNGNTLVHGVVPTSPSAQRHVATAIESMAPRPAGGSKQQSWDNMVVSKTAASMLAENKRHSSMTPGTMTQQKALEIARAAVDHHLNLSQIAATTDFDSASFQMHLAAARAERGL